MLANNSYQNTNDKYCEFCQKPLPAKYRRTVCPSCVERLLFQKVKEYIRANDVNEYQVASKFNIPLSTVQNWIREGRIEYKEKPNQKVITTHCQICDAPIAFGTLCAKCRKEQSFVSALTEFNPNEPGNMRHLKIDDNDRK